MIDRAISPRNRSAIDMSAVIPWTNESGETVPAYGVVQLRTNFSGASKASKPSSTDGLFFVNGMVTVAATKSGESLTWDKPRPVLINGTVTVGDEVGPVSGQWYMDTAGSGFRVLRQPSGGVGVVVASSGGGGAGGPGTGCGCNCLDNGDILVNGYEMSSAEVVGFNEPQEFPGTNGTIILPAGTYTMTWDSGAGKWILDVGAYLIATYNDGSSATSATTMDGELTMEWASAGSDPIVKLCITGSVSAKPVASGFSAGYSAGFADGYAACLEGSAPDGSTVFGSFSGTGSETAEYDEGFADGYDVGYAAGAELCVDLSGSAAGSGLSGSGAIPP